MKVKIIKVDDICTLEKEINKFLSTIDDSQIIDIKYQVVAGKHEYYNPDHPSVMIIMK